MGRRWGWLSLALVSGLFFLATAFGGAWAIGLAVGDGASTGTLLSIVSVAFGVLFWWWIAAGAWLRAYPPIDPDTGEPVRSHDEVGPWGVVGRVMLGTMVVAFVAFGQYAANESRIATGEAETVREQAERIARRQEITVADVEQSVEEGQRWRLGGSRGPDPYQSLIAVDDASVRDLSVTAEGAAILVEPDRGPPCVIVTVDRDDLVRSRLAGTCP